MSSGRSSNLCTSLPELDCSNQGSRVVSSCNEGVTMIGLSQIPFRSLLAIICAIALLPGEGVAYPSPPQQATTPSSTAQAAKIPTEQLDSLVAPIALYPDPLLAQILAASTYPLEIVQL